MTRPNRDQPERETLPPDVVEAIDATMARYRVEYPRTPERRGNGLGTVLVALVLAVLAGTLLVLTALFIDRMDGRPAGPPIMVTTNPTPCPTGGVLCR